jgi:hypothetical protein
MNNLQAPPRLNNQRSRTVVGHARGGTGVRKFAVFSPVDTLIAMHRSQDGGELCDRFRSLRLNVEGEEEQVEQVDLVVLAKRVNGDQ